MAFAVDRDNHVSGPHKAGKLLTLFVSEGRRQIMGIPGGVNILNGRGEILYSRKSGDKPIKLSAEITVYPLDEDEQASRIEHLPELV